MLNLGLLGLANRDDRESLRFTHLLTFSGLTNGEILSHRSSYNHSRTIFSEQVKGMTVRYVNDRSLVDYLQGDRQLHLGEADLIALVVLP
jgi:hypothetical protein